MADLDTGRLLDRRGKSITTFVVFDLDAELKTMFPGESVELITDDFEPFERDIRAWCQSTGHRMINWERAPDGLRFIIEKGLQTPKTTKLAMVISTDGLAELLSPLGLALAAALEGIAVHIYVQGPAVHVLARGFKPKLRGLGRMFSRFAAAGMTKSGHIPARDKLTQIRSLGGTIYVCGPSMEQFKVNRHDLVFDDLPIVEYLTFMSIMEGADIQLYV